MSKKSSARTGSEGDAADANYTDTYDNICSRSSSCKSKKDIDRGPYGDSPAERHQHCFNDFLILMNHDSEETTETSEESDQDLYNLKNDYLRKLNILRKNLNLTEISEKENKTSNIGCIITEIVDEERLSENIEQEATDNIELEENFNENFIEEYENGPLNITTIHPFSISYTVDTNSMINFFDVDYNPPKKKVCCRIKTPKFPTTFSDSNLPYHTKVSLREDLFKQEDASKSKTNPNKTTRKSISKFTDTKETQCIEEDFKEVEAAFTNEPVVLEERQESSLFPEVLIKNKLETNHMQETENLKTLRNQRISTASNGIGDEGIKNFPLYNVRNTNKDGILRRPNSTIINQSFQNKHINRSRHSNKRNKIYTSEQITMWDEIKKLHSAENEHVREEHRGMKLREFNCPTLNKITNYIETFSKNMPSDNVKSGDYNRTNDEYEDTKQNQYLRDYLNYKREIRKVKSFPVTNAEKKTVPYGTKISHNFNKSRDSEECQESSDTELEETDKDTEFSNIKEDEDNNKARRRSFWDCICSCFCLPVRSENEKFYI